MIERMRVEVVGIEKACRTFASITPAVMRAWRKEVAAAGRDLLRAIKSGRVNKPKKDDPGPGQKLSRQTGTLSRDINQRDVATSDTISSSVGSRVGYGAIWVRGYDAQTSRVKAHMRGGDRVAAFVRSLKGQKPRDYLRPELKAQAADIRKRLMDVPRKVTEAMSK